MARRHQAMAPVGKPRHASESIRDLAHAIEEMDRAKDEIAAIDASGETSRYRVKWMYVEPMARLELVRRYIVQVHRRHKWRTA